MGWRCGLLCLTVIVLFVNTSNCEIHRAKPGSSSAGNKYRANSHVHVLPTAEDVLFTSARSTAWLYSLVSAMAVGLSGIFPLVIPIEAGPALKHGAAAARLKLLLSFAVGGLLGDVFLHLLPETWAHIDKEDHGAHTTIGLWILGGILTFLIIEKIFADESEFAVLEDECSDNEEEEEGKITTGQKTTKNIQLRQRGTVENNNKKCLANGQVSAAENNKNPHQNKSDTKTASQRENSIRVSGYLNLLANCIDNFTHGLAVGGSYLVSTKIGLLTTFAILIHEIPHEVGDFAILLRSGFSRWNAAKAQMVTATGGMIGAATALLAESAQVAGDMTAWILPFTSGGFIYIALVTVVPDLLQERHPWESFKQVASLVGGIAVMGAVTFLCE